VVFVLYHWICFFLKSRISKGLVAIHGRLLNKESNMVLRKYFFSERVVDRWNKLDQTDIDCESINGFKNKLM